MDGVESKTHFRIVSDGMSVFQTWQVLSALSHLASLAVIESRQFGASHTGRPDYICREQICPVIVYIHEVIHGCMYDSNLLTRIRRATRS